MGQKYVYIATPEWFENSALKNPINFLDHKLEPLYPQFYKAEYDLKLCAAKAPAEAERNLLLYNDYLERYGNSDIAVLRQAAERSPARNVFLNGFRQEHLEYLARYIQDSVELLYLFKCSSIKDLSILSTFSKLKCVLIFWNNKLETLWDFQNNPDLTVLSFDYITKLRDIASLKQSNVEYIAFNSTDNCGNRKPCLIENPEVFDEMPKLKHLSLIYRKNYINY